LHEEASIEILYPPPGVRLFVPRNVAGEYEKVVLRAAHRGKNARLLWYLDDRFIGQTQGNHEQTMDLQTGYHELFVQDEEGNSKQAIFLAIGKKD
jgi:penicillin-binding protein 1C